MSEESSQVDAIASVEEHPFRTVWGLAWPAVLLNALQTLNALLDSSFLDKIGGDALTAIGASTTSLFLLVSMSMALGVAATALVARLYGAGDTEGFREANRKCLGFAVASGVVLGLLSLPLAGPAMRLFLPPEEANAIHLATQYLMIVALFLPAVFIIQSLAGSLRGIGDTKSPMIVSGLQILFHIVLNYLMIFPAGTREVFGMELYLPGAGMGVAGAAWALVISSWIAAIGYVLWVSRTPLGNVAKIRLPDFGWVKRIYRLAAPAGLMSIVRVTSLMAFQIVLKAVPEGAIAIGAIRPGFSIESLAFMPSFGLAIAASALVGQSLGMERPDRARSLGWMAAHQAAIVSTVVAIFLFIFADQVALLVLGEQEEYAHMVASYLRFVATTETLFGYGMVFISAQQGAGDTKRPFWLVFITMWGLRVPLAAYLALDKITVNGMVFDIGLGMGANGCWLTLAITQAIQGFAAMWLWHKGDWAYAKV